MFKGLAGLKKAVKGGFSVVAETSSQLAEQVVGDPSTSKDNLKESIKKKVATVVEATDSVIAAEGTHQAKDKAAEVVHKVKHYGAFGEEYLGYSDPTKDLRKAVKQKEKAAKKAKKANKKRTGKKEDLFDPENLAKYKRDIEQRRLEQEAVQAQAADPESEDEDKAGSDKDPENQKLKFTLDLAPESPQDLSNAATPVRSPFRSPVRTPKEDKEDWKLFQSLTSGVDSLIQEKKSKLEELKQESYFQKKQSQPEEDRDKGAKKKKWINLDAAGFEDFDGTISGEEEEDLKPVHREDKKEDQPDKKEGEEDEEEGDKLPEGFVDIPEDEPVDLDAEEDIFNTDFVDAVTSGDVKLAVIPDSPVYDDDPFNTGFAEEIVKKDKEEKRREASRIKFTGLSSVADVLSGKADKVDSSLVELTVKQKRRRANRINLIAEKQTDVTAREDIGTFGNDNSSSSAATAEQKDIFSELDTENAVQVGDLLSTSQEPCASVVPISAKSGEGQANTSSGNSGLLDLAEFEDFCGQKGEASLTSNVAILAGEFSKPAEEEVDDFDAAFDALAQESVTKYKLDELEKEFADEDVFDTTAVDNILNLVSLSNKVEDTDNVIYENFDDKDPFDTSAYDDIAGVLEEELGFESLAKRDPKEEAEGVEVGAGADVFGAPTAQEPVIESGWAAFKEDKPSRPPPPKPKPEPPRRPPQGSIL